MKKLLAPLVVVGAIAGPVSGCSTTPVTQEQAAIVLTSGAAGAVAGQIIGRDTEGTLAGAAIGIGAGTLIAATRNRQTCYYANGRGGYYEAAC